MFDTNLSIRSVVRGLVYLDLVLAAGTAWFALVAVVSSDVDHPYNVSRPTVSDFLEMTTHSGGLDLMFEELLIGGDPARGLRLLYT
jgi:hypothetical protein